MATQDNLQQTEGHLSQYEAISAEMAAVARGGADTLRIHLADIKKYVEATTTASAGMVERAKAAAEAVSNQAEGGN